MLTNMNLPDILETQDFDFRVFSDRKVSKILDPNRKEEKALETESKIYFHLEKIIQRKDRIF